MFRGHCRMLRGDYRVLRGGNSEFKDLYIALLRDG